jgi:hypothetical protein
MNKRQGETMSKTKLIATTLFFTFFYTSLFFFISNYLHWYFNGEFLYDELVGDGTYYMYNWIGNLLTTVTVAVVIFFSELIRNFLKLRKQ